MPFLDDNNENEEYYSDDGMSHLGPKQKKENMFGEKRFYLIGGVASIVAFLAVIIYVYVSSKPVDLDDLPVIQAEDTPVKVKPENNQQVAHQDKLVYDNISGNVRVLKDRIAPKPEEPLEEYRSIRETDDNDVLSQEEKDSIIKEFDELAPKRKYAQSVSAPEKKELHNAQRGGNVAEEGRTENLAPVRDAEKELRTSRSKPHKKKAKFENDSVEQFKKQSKGTVMIQVASVGSKSAAEAEYKRILRKNPFLKSVGKRIMKVDLGSKGVKYRLQVGPFEDKQKANKVISMIKNNGFFGYISR